MKLPFGGSGKIFLSVSTLILVLLGCFVCLRLAFQADYDKIQPGMTVDEALASLSKPPEVFISLPDESDNGQLIFCAATSSLFPKTTIELKIRKNHVAQKNIRHPSVAEILKHWSSVLGF